MFFYREKCEKQLRKLKQTNLRLAWEVLTSILVDDYGPNFTVCEQIKKAIQYTANLIWWLYSAYEILLNESIRVGVTILPNCNTQSHGGPWNDYALILAWLLFIFSDA